jgi:hypothetical protein
MGPIPPYDGRPRYFLDLYIPSYTPTLSTLIESSNPGSHSFDKPSIVLISQPDASLPGAFKEMQVVQATNTQVTTLISAMATPTAVLERLRDHNLLISYAMEYSSQGNHSTLHSGFIKTSAFRCWTLYDPVFLKPNLRSCLRATRRS